MSTDTSAVANLSPQQMKDAAQNALQQKEDQRNALVRSGGVTKFIQTAQNSLLFQPDCRWDDMLSGAPLSIAVMGSIFVASIASSIAAVTILPPKEGFKYISTFSGPSGEMSLQAALVQVASKGSQAFMLASTNMQAIASYSDAIIGKIKEIGQLLGDPPSAQMMLKPTVDALKKSAQAAAKLAKEVADAYHNWLGATCEVHAACCQTSTDNAEKLRANKVHLAAEQAQLQQGQQAVDVAKENLDTLKASLQHVDEQYKKAADEFPSGWGLVGMEIVSNLAATANSALNQAIPVLVSKLSYTAQAGEALNLFKGDKGSIKGEQAADHSKVPDATSKNTLPPNAPVLPEDYTDIAYNIIRSSYGHIQTVASLLSGQDGKVDWDSITSTDSEKVKSGLSVTKILLDGDFKALGVKTDEKQPTKNLKKVIQVCLTVIGEVNQYTGSNLAGKSKPADDSDEVKKWKKDINQAYIDATALYQISRTIPGADTPAMPPPAGVTPAVPDGSGFRAQIIGAATAKLNSTSAVLQTTQTNFQASSKDYLKAIKDLGVIQAQLATLKTNKVQLDQIRALLLKCIELLVQLQNQINKLVAFFDAINSIVTVAVETQVDPFIDQISAVTSAPLTLGGYTITEFTSVLLFNSMLNIRCYFTLFKDLARLYVDIHQKYLIKGLQLQGELSSEDTGPEAAKQLQAKQAQLNAYTNDNLPRIKDDITTRQQNTIDSMKDNADAAAKDVRILPNNPPALQHQIEGASKQSIETAQKGIETSGSYARTPLSFPSE